MKTSALNDQAGKAVATIKNADILVGIPSYNNEETIGHVAEAAKLGLAKYYPDAKAVLFNSDGGSSDQTSIIFERVAKTNSYDTFFVSEPHTPLAAISTPYIGSPGKGSAFKAIFEAARLLKVKACAVLDSDLRSVTPEWIQLLLAPVLHKDYGYVCPFYRRYKYDGTITNSIAYPLTRALYGRRVRQPIGGDFGFAGSLIDLYLQQDVWETDVTRFGIDIWMTTTAIVENTKICQSFMGAKIHDVKDPGADLGPMFIQVVGTIFSLMAANKARWQEVIGSRPTAILGFQSETAPRPLQVNVSRMMAKFTDGVSAHTDLYRRVLTPETFAKLLEVAEMAGRTIDFPKTLWVRIIYDFAVFYQSTTERAALLESLIPLYYGFISSFVHETENLDDYQAEEVVEKLCEVFEDSKPYLLERWQQQ
ncbi:MAG: glycosyl transferase family 2 [Deltaproteobacteria bacterium]|nr:glycosyl transferase family 2 [Candidatus Anaeroferrophillus wilburensis]MBN2889741.1 glycosyl transferase family 2 [Deltaproteobacteria bacterium]